MVRQLFGSRWLTRRSSNRRRRRESTIAARGGSLGAVAYAGASFEPLEGRAMLAVMISQYVETNSGSVPKGIEVWNPTATPIDFSGTNLEVRKGTNGAATQSDFILSSGTLAAGDVWVIGTSDLGTYLDTTFGAGAKNFSVKAFTFNGDDSLELYLGGTLVDVFGDPGTGDPGTGWAGNGVQTYDQNIQILDGITSGTTTAWTDPSTRFETVSTTPAAAGGLAGFGVAPITATTAPTLATTPTSAAVAASSATLGGDVTATGGSPITERGVVYALTSANATPTIGGSGVVQVADGTPAVGAFSVPVTGLTASSGYSFRAYATNAVGTTYSDVATFTTTAGATAPSIASPTAASITDVSATLGGDVSGDGDATITERGVVFAPTNTNADPLIDGTGVTKLTAAGTTGAFTVEATGLTASTGYSFKAFATNSVGTTYTTVATFSTITTPAVSTPTQTSITYDAATLGGTVDTDGAGTVTERGVVYALTSVNPDPEIGGTGVSKLAAGSGGTGTFTTRATGLQPGSAYTFKAYATNAAGTTYTAVDTFTTTVTPIVQWTFEGDVTTPAVGTGTASLEGGTTATFASGSPGQAWNVTNFPAQGTESGVRGTRFLASTVGRENISFSVDIRATGTASRWAQVDYTLDGGANWVTGFWNNAGGLSPDGSFVSSTIDFSSIAAANNNPGFGVRVVSIFSPQAFNQNTSLSYAADAAYMRANTSATYDGTPPGTSTSDYATTGLWRFDNVTLTGDPLPAVLPTVTSPTSAAITPSAATLGGTVTADGFATVTERGVVYALTSDNANPEIGGTGVTKVAAAANGSGAFTVDVSGLTNAGNYTFRAYATNSVGTAYSTADTFTTLAAATAPVVALGSPAVSGITTTAASLAADVTSDGGDPITERGFVYSLTATNADPLINGTGVTKVTVAGTTGSLTTDLANLDPAAGYSFKAFATNAVGTTYTSVSPFDTLAPTTTALIGISPLTATANQTVTFTGTVTADAGSATPAGTVEIRVGGPTGTLLASTSTIGGSGVNGTFSIATPSIPIGSYSGIQAFFVPAAGFAESNSAAFGSTLEVNAAAFTPGNLLVLRVGDGTTSVTSDASGVFLLEYALDGTLVQSIPVTSAGGSALTVRGNSTTEGVLSLSADRQLVTFGGHRADAGTSDPNDAAVDRVIGKVDGSAAVNTAQGISGIYVSDSLRSVATDDGSRFWLSGGTSTSNGPGTGGVRFVASDSATTSASLELTRDGIAQANANTRQIQIIDGNLFVSAGSNSPGRSIFQVGSGIPGTSPQALSAALPLAQSSQYQSFVFADLDTTTSWGDTGYDTLYATDSSAGAIVKFGYVVSQGTGSWVANGTVNHAGASSLTGYVSGPGTFSLFVTSSTTATGGLSSLVDDTGYNQDFSGKSVVSLTNPVEAGSNYALRGVTFVPRSGVATTTTVTNVSPTTLDAGQQVTLTATVVAQTGGTTPTGSVLFRSNGVLLATAPITGSDATGTATATTTTIPFGTYANITAQYVPDGNPSANVFNPSTSAAFGTPLVVEQPGVVTTTTLTNVSPTTAAYTNAVTFTGQVSPADSSTPSGTLEIRDGGSSGLLLGSTTTFGSDGSFQVVTSTAIPSGTYTDVRAYFVAATGFKNSASTAFGTPLNVTFTTLGMGDLAFTAMRPANPDAFAFVLLKDVIAGTTITFTDNAWTGSALATNEGSSTITLTRAFTAGTVFDFERDRADGFWRSAGNTGSPDYTGIDHVTTSNFTLNNSGDNLFAYQGPAPTSGSDANWIAAYSSLAFLTTGGAGTSDTYMPAAFTPGNTAFSPALSGDQNAGIGLAAVTGSPASIRTAIYDPANWSSTFTLPSPTTFTLTAASATVAVSGTATAFTTTYGTASASQSFSVSGFDLTADITVTAPTGFEVSNDGTTWGTTTSFVQSAGLASGTLRVRLAATATVNGTYDSQTFTVASTDATPVTIQTVASGNTVTPAPLTVTAANVTKPFGVAISGGSGSAAFTTAGLVNGDTVGTVTIAYGTGASAADTVNTYAGQVTASALTGGTFDSANYAITYVAGDIIVTADPIALITGTLAAFTTIYGTASAAQTFTLTGYNLTGDLSVAAPTGFEVSADGTTFQTTVALTPAGGTVNSALVYVRIAAATPANSALTGSVTVSGGGTPSAVTVVIPTSIVSRKTLTIAGLTGDGKIYDRTTTATASGTATLDGVVNADTVILSGTPTFTFTTAAAGPNRSITVAGYTLSGGDATNYDLEQPALTAAITPASVTVTGVTVTSKVYDGTTGATISGGTLSGVLGGDDVSIATTGVFASKNANPAVSVTPDLTGADAGNYAFSLPTGVTGEITTRPVTIAGIAIAPKVFDGLLSATITGTPALDDIVVGDVVTLDTATAAASFADATIGTGKQVTITGYLISGADVGNYAFTQPTGISGDILAPTFTRWTFDTDSLEPFFGAGTAANVGGTSTTYATGNGGGRGWNTSSYAAQGVESGQRGVEFMVSTAGRSDISFSFDHRGSGSSSRWAQVDYTLDGGQTWVTNHWRNDGGLSPHDTFATYYIDFSGVSGAANNPDFGVRIVSIFSPLAFDQSSTLDPFAADSAYMRANANAVYSPNESTATGDYGGGTWRFDNVTFRGVPGGPVVNAASATETLRIVTYNIASSGDNGLPRTGLDTVLQAIGTETVGGYSGAIDLLALQEVQSQAVTSAAVVSSLNAIYGADTYAHGAVDGASSGSGTVGVIYNTGSLTLLEETAITTGGPRQSMRYLFRPTAATGAESFYVYVSHLKSTADTASENTRAAEAAAIRVDADQLGPGVSVLYLGDFNLYTSNEVAYQTLVGAGNGQAFDPINQPGAWSNDANFTGIHTQAPKNTAPSGLVGGGLDDRFDFQLVSNEVNGDGLGLRYVSGSYRAFGNNGSVGLNGDIDSGSNTALAGLANRSTVLGLLGTVSDHLPVVADYTVPVAAAIGSMTTTYGAASAAQSFVVSATELTGNLTVTAPSGFEMATTEFGSYGTSAITLAPTNGVVTETLFVRLAGTAAGTFSGNITITGGGAADETLTIGTSTVNKAVLTVSGSTPTVADREYDGTTTATVSLTGVTLTGIVGSDDVSLSTTGAFASANAANGIAVTLMLAGTARDNYDLTDPGITGNITPKALSITAASLADREYDGTTTAGALTIGTLSGFIGSETVTATGSATNYASANAGTYAGVAVTYALADGSGGGLAANYTLADGSATGVVTPRAITLTALATSKTYGDADPALFYQITSGSQVTGDTFTGTLARAAGENVANSPYAINQGTLSLGGNYTITFVNADLTITPKALTVTGLSAQDKTYDGTTGVTVSGTPTYDGLVNGETFAVSGAVTWAFADANVDVAKPLVRTGNFAAPNANYSVTQPALTAAITTRALTVTADATSKTYGDTDPALTYGITSGSLADGDALTGSLARATGENVAGSPYAITLGSLSAGDNYTVTFVGANLTITPRTITITADSKSKTYGDTDPALSYAITSGNLVAGDAFSGTLARATGENVADSPYAIALGSLSAGSNYAITFVGADLTIIPKALTITGLTATNKIYDGTTAAAVAGTPVFDGLVAGENFAVTGAVTWAFADANVGNDKPLIRAGDFAAPSANYTLTQPTGLVADITPKALSITGLTAGNKVYDGTAAAAVSGTPAYAGLVAGETFAVNGSVTWAFADPNTGTAKPLVRTGDFASPNGNYALTQPTGLTADITPKALSITGLTAGNKVYDGTVSAPVTGTPAYAGLVAGETFAVTGEVTWAFADPNAGTAKPISRSGDFASPNGNYALTQPTGLTADITPKPLTITGLAAIDKVYDGTASAVITGTPAFDGLVDGETFTVAGDVTWAFADPNAGTAKSISRSGDFAAPSPNYTLTQPAAFSAAITPRPVTIRALDVSKNTGETLTGGPGSTAFDAAGLVSGDTIGSVSIAYGAAAAGGALGGRYAGQVIPSAATGGTFDPANYAFTYTPGDIVVVTVNQPASIALANVVTSLPENTATASAVKLADIVVTDDGLGDNVFSLSGPDAAAFTIVDGALFLRAGTALDFETKAAYDVTVGVSDAELPGQVATAAYALAITDANDAPTAILLSAATIAENAPAGTVIGAFSTADADAADAFTYTLVTGEGDTDNTRFSIDGDRLVSAEPLNHELLPNPSIRVRSTDAAGGFTEQVFTITVTDVDEPLLIEGVESPTEGMYRQGDTLRFTVVLTRPVEVNGNPRLQFGLGNNPSVALFGRGRRTATYTGGTGTNRLSFEYTIGRRDSAEQVFLGAAVVGRRVVIRDADGTALDTRLPVVNEQVAGVQIDTAGPRPVGRIGLPARGTYRLGDALTFRVNFSEAVLVSGTPALEVRIGRETRQATYVSGAGTQELVFEYRVAEGDATVGRRGISARPVIALSEGATIADAAGNAATLRLRGPFAARVTVDGRLAAAAGVQELADGGGRVRARARAAAFARFTG